LKCLYFGLIGFRTEYLTATAGTGLMYHVFDRYDHYVHETLGQRVNGVLVSMVAGKALAYAPAGSDENIILAPPVRFSLEQALEFIDDDELVEVTPKSVRLRKKLLREADRRRDSRHTPDAGRRHPDEIRHRTDLRLCSPGRTGIGESSCQRRSIAVHARFACIRNSHSWEQPALPR
jgi:hypothetical protein